MKVINYSLFVLLSILMINCSSPKGLAFENAQTEAKCSEKGGTWYKGKCWAGYEDDGISKADIEAKVAEEMKSLEQMNIMINKESYPISFLFPQEENGIITLITIYEKDGQEMTLLSEIDGKKMSKKSIPAKSTLFDTNLMEINEEEGTIEELQKRMLAKGDLEVTALDMDEFQLEAKGVLENKKDASKLEVSFTTNEAMMGAGNSKFEIKGNEAMLSGTLGTKTYHQLKNIIENHPEVKTIVLGQVSGSVNDAVNMHTGRILREAGLNTKLLKNSDIASGGVDLFCAGKERIVEKGAKIGIHSWCCIDELTAIEIPKDHPAHKYQIDYFTMCLGEETGPAFYFRTLEAAPFDGIHYMTDEAIKEWTVSTKFINQ